MFNDLKNKIEGFYKMTETQSDSFLRELNSRINREPEKFKEFMAKAGYGYDTNRPICYEAMTRSSQTKWSHYILKELKALIEKAESGSKR